MRSGRRSLDQLVEQREGPGVGRYPHVGLAKVQCGVVVRSERVSRAGQDRHLGIAPPAREFPQPNIPSGCATAAGRAAWVVAVRPAAPRRRTGRRGRPSPSCRHGPSRPAGAWRSTERPRDCRARLNWRAFAVTATVRNASAASLRSGEPEAGSCAASQSTNDAASSAEAPHCRQVPNAYWWNVSMSSLRNHATSPSRRCSSRSIGSSAGRRARCALVSATAPATSVSGSWRIRSRRTVST